MGRLIVIAINYSIYRECMPKRYALFFCKKDSEKIIRDTWASITYYFAKYHVILCKVSLVSKKALPSLDFLGCHRFCRTRIALRTRMWSLTRLCCLRFLRTRIVRMTRIGSLTWLCSLRFLRTRIVRMARIGSLTRLCLPLSLIKNINQDKHPMLGKLSYFEFLM